MIVRLRFYLALRIFGLAAVVGTVGLAFLPTGHPSHTFMQGRIATGRQQYTIATAPAAYR